MLVEINDLAFEYEKNVPVIKDVSLTLRNGDIAAVLGPSGSGKSTLLRILAGLEVPKEGTISVSGTPWLNQFHALSPQKREVGMLFQSYALFPHLTVEKNILFGLKGLTKKEKNDKVNDMLSLVGLTHKRKNFPHELSGGQVQRVALARALAPEPKILLLDEPFSNLDETLKTSIRKDLLEILLRSKTTASLVTHDDKDAEAIANRIFTFEDGILKETTK
jgi:iron(III) transport system ATP-binding protein